MTPLERKFRGGGGGLIGRTIRWGGMDIFWNHTIGITETKITNSTGLNFNPNLPQYQFEYIQLLHPVEALVCI